jgi:hypothetical protein
VAFYHVCFTFLIGVLGWRVGFFGHAFHDSVDNLVGVLIREGSALRTAAALAFVGWILRRGSLGLDAIAGRVKLRLGEIQNCKFF